MSGAAALRGDVIVVTYDAEQLVGRCLRPLLDDLPDGWTITVADNDSQDGTVALVEREFPEVRLISLPGNPGFVAGNNAAAAVGDGDVVVMVNPDAFVEPGCLRALVAPMEADPEVGMVAGMTLRPGGEEVDGFGIAVDHALIGHNRGRGDAPTADPRGVLLGPEGCLAAYRRVAWEAVGGLDPRLKAYGEDLDLALRIRALGWRAAATDQARAVHLGSASIGVGSPRQREWSSFTRGLLLRRYGVLTSAGAPRALAHEAMAVGIGLVRHRSLVPLRARVAGWRAAGSTRVPVAPATVDRSVTFREALLGW